MATILRAETPGDVAAVRGLMREFTSWAMSLDPEAASTAPTFDNLDRELAGLPGPFGPPEGCLLLARDATGPAGCVGFQGHGPGTVELKRMYVRPDRRGTGIGSALVAALIAEARTIGARRMVLDSCHSMTGAHRIYRAAGFGDVPAPAGFPVALIPRVVFMEIALA